MAALTLPTPADPVVQVLGSAQVLQAYLECSDELQVHAKKMIRAMNDPELDIHDRHLAAETLCEILFPSFSLKYGMLGYDLEKANDLCKNHGLPDDHPDAAGLNEGAAALAALEAERATFSVRLEAAMSAAGLSQTALAERAGVSQPAISLLLKRECRPQRRTVVKLAKALGVEPSSLWPEFKGDE